MRYFTSALMAALLLGFVAPAGATTGGSSAWKIGNGNAYVRLTNSTSRTVKVDYRVRVLGSSSGLDRWGSFVVAPHSMQYDRYDDKLVLVTVKVRVVNGNWDTEISGFAGPHHAFLLTETPNGYQLRKD